VPPGIAEQVAEHLMQPVLVALDHHGVAGQFEHPAMIGPGGPRIAGHVDGQP